ncbi:MAG: hypothetical protein COU10_02075 [Candidatus Harrisonbacteria bacterium CG10_big_fil_rev_8_21_14_0_10_45_28]|uniref:Glycosyltransferase RgtA/B/C/D-like domain-containing protein n=1 Tax=Candidatus Harrisonbacteria bacterium CG10_big_fil_rev_8_21_14_0_10_45_28 TaxID=1974586 RepID=A0A2H0UNB9_9BACT|nr:MAG: hypothetical protein COU10_02075 [Candidatus Harrisonbacteria bacterium CG10_big_fil_rev_8_21_14_0_10_45_28]
MDIQNKNTDWLRLVFIIFVAAYASLFLIGPFLGPTDDFYFLRTLQVGKPMLPYSQSFPYFNFLSRGRFAPLGAMEYNLPAFFSASAFSYFLYHSIQFILLAVMLIFLISRVTSKKLLIYGIPILLFLTPEFTISFFRMQMTERIIIILFALLLLCYSLYLEKRKIWYLLVGFIAANLVIYFKEPIFVVIGVFAVSYLFLSRKIADKKIKIFNGLLLLSSLAYAVIYYFHVYLHLGPVLYSSNPYNPLLVFIKNFLNYGFFSDPILILILLPMTAWRIYKIFIRRQESHPFYDSCLITASAYVLMFFALNMYGLHYLLPAYVLAIPALIYFLVQKKEKMPFIKTAGFIAGFILIFNTLPSGIHYLTYYKYLPVNFNKTLAFLIQDIDSRHPNERVNIFLDGIDRGTGRDTYFILSEFLQFKGLSNLKFNLKSDIETKNASPLALIKPGNPTPPFTVFETDKTDKIASGDYLVISPQTPKNINKPYLQSLNKDYELVFQTKSPLAFPNLNLKTLAKYFLSRKISQSQKEKGVMTNENLMQWPDYYVLIRK